MRRRSLGGVLVLGTTSVLALAASGCIVALGPDLVAPAIDAGVVDASTASDLDGATSVGTDAATNPTTIARLDRDLFFCRVQPEIVTRHGCAAGGRDCHASQTSLRLDPSADGTRIPCVDGHPTADVPAAYYTNHARSVPFTRTTAAASPFVRHPQGSSHPVRLFTASSEEAALLRLWIEGGAR